MDTVIHLVRTDTAPPRWVCDLVPDAKTPSGYRIVDFSADDMTPGITERLHRGLAAPAMTRDSDDSIPDTFDGGGKGIGTAFPGDADHLENACRQIPGLAVSSKGRVS